MSLFSLGLLAAYFAGGMQYMMNQEGWDAADAFYFWCMTVSTVGYGDLAPTTPKTQETQEQPGPYSFSLLFITRSTFSLTH